MSMKIKRAQTLQFAADTVDDKNAKSLVDRQIGYERAAEALAINDGGSIKKFSSDAKNNVKFAGSSAISVNPTTYTTFGEMCAALIKTNSLNGVYFNPAVTNAIWSDWPTSLNNITQCNIERLRSAGGDDYIKITCHDSTHRIETQRRLRNNAFTETWTTVANEENTVKSITISLDGNNADLAVLMHSMLKGLANNNTFGRISVTPTTTNVPPGLTITASAGLAFIISTTGDANISMGICYERDFGGWKGCWKFQITGNGSTITWDRLDNDIDWLPIQTSTETTLLAILRQYPKQQRISVNPTVAATLTDLPAGIDAGWLLLDMTGNPNASADIILTSTGDTKYVRSINAQGWSTGWREQASYTRKLIDPSITRFVDIAKLYPVGEYYIRYDRIASYTDRPVGIATGITQMLSIKAADNPFQVLIEMQGQSDLFKWYCGITSYDNGATYSFAYEWNQSSNLYTTREVTEGKWYDGRTIYRRTYTGNVNALNTRTLIVPQNAFTIIKFEGGLRLPNYPRSLVPLNTYASSGRTVYTDVDGGGGVGITVASGNDAIGAFAEITIWYVK